MLNSQSQLVSVVKDEQYYSEFIRPALVKVAHISMILCILVAGVKMAAICFFFVLLVNSHLS